MLIVAAVPPPLPGDDRTEILYTVRATLDALLAGDVETARASFDAGARFDFVDAKDGAPGEAVNRSLDEMLKIGSAGANYREPFGIPTVLQDGRLAQVWVPYSFWVNGAKSHCGIDNVTLVEGEDGWKITQFSFTMTPLDTCEGLGAPTVPEPGAPEIAE